jgi:hypothetical protein
MKSLTVNEIFAKKSIFPGTFDKRKTFDIEGSTVEPERKAKLEMNLI